MQTEFQGHKFIMHQQKAITSTRQIYSMHRMKIKCIMWMIFKSFRPFAREFLMQIHLEALSKNSFKFKGLKCYLCDIVTQFFVRTLQFDTLFGFNVETYSGRQFEMSALCGVDCSPTLCYWTHSCNIFGFLMFSEVSVCKLLGEN